MEALILIFQLIVLLFSVIVHEVSHGLMALRLGDDTAKVAGRLTLNPLKHLDPIGSILVPIITSLAGVTFGWAKPVPYNPFALYKDYKYGPLKVALIGPFSNIILAAVFGIIIRLGSGFLSPVTLALLALVVLINCVLAVLNLLPIPPLDGSKILTVLFPKYSIAIQSIGLGGIFLVLLFIFFFGEIIFAPAFMLFRLFAGSTGTAAINLLLGGL